MQLKKYSVIGRGSLKHFFGQTCLQMSHTGEKEVKDWHLFKEKSRLWWHAALFSLTVFYFSAVKFLYFPDFVPGSSFFQPVIVRPMFFIDPVPGIGTLHFSHDAKDKLGLDVWL